MESICQECTHVKSVTVRHEEGDAFEFLGCDNLVLILAVYGNKTGRNHVIEREGQQIGVLVTACDDRAPVIP